MARVTVEDCLDHVDNRFELILLASKRARQLARHNVDPTVDWDNDKPTVVALREIAEGNVTKDLLSQQEKEYQEFQSASLDQMLLNSSISSVMDDFKF